MVFIWIRAPSYGAGGQILQMEISMDISNQQWETLPSTALSVSPNPANAFLNIEVNPIGFQLDRFQLTLADATGRMLRQQVIKNQPQNNITWPVDKLQNGVYYLRLSTSQGSRTRKVMVQQ